MTDETDGVTPSDGTEKKEKMADVLMSLISELGDKVTVSYRDKEGETIGTTVFDSPVDQEHEGCQPNDPRIETVEIHASSKVWQFNREDLEEFRNSY